MALALSYEEVLEITEALDNDEQISDKLYQKLFNYYCCDSGEMPYGTAKARDGDPYEFIDARLPALIGRLV